VVELVVRLVFSLAVVVGLLLLCARVASRRFTGKHSSLVKVLHRQPISRNAAVSVVDVGGRVLVLGTTDQGVRLLTELDASALPTGDRDDAGRVAGGDGRVEGPGLSLVPTLPAADPEPILDTTSDLTDEAPATSQARLEESLLDAWSATATGSLASAGPAPRAGSGRHSHRAARTPTRGRRGGARRASAPAPAPAAAATTGALAGSLLSPQTWRQAWAVVSRRAS